ncbi:metallophosphoesterase [Paenibacillus sp. MBLB2552]|uniref:Metallophosphoesterase n=1 Tax=Paenibacillus mellifer TaxID=2937794 RepID=A0A9X2BRW0_9BACL|nr:metallophosphoesterase [Paenibacillus mellifer]MCK8486081.1 metallophosphoesterase [Paenibacillus mellifer]
MVDQNGMKVGEGRRDEELLLAFQVITDTHVRADEQHTHNVNLELALRDIVENGAESAGIMHAGDVTDHGFPEEYEAWNRIWEQFGGRLPPLYVTMGNHDVALGNWEARLGQFLRGTGTEDIYHDHWIDGYHFVFLGTEEGLELFSSLSEKQLAWLDDKLGESATADRPVFVFLHQPLMNTVAGSYEAQRWYGVVQDAELRAVLARHPQAILFTGHTHWELDAPNTSFGVRGEGPAMFNAASVAYLWSDEDEHKNGSQGFYVEVYRDHVLVRGRDFTRGEWVEAAQFRVEYPRG